MKNGYLCVFTNQLKHTHVTNCEQSLTGTESTTLYSYICKLGQP